MAESEAVVLEEEFELVAHTVVIVIPISVPEVSLSEVHGAITWLKNAQNVVCLVFLLVKHSLHVCFALVGTHAKSALLPTNYLFAHVSAVLPDGVTYSLQHQILNH